MLTKDLFDQLVAVLLNEMHDADARKALVQSALVGSPVLQRISWAGDQRTFTIRLVRVLTDFGTLPSGRPAIAALLEEVRGQVGGDRQADIDAVLAQFTAASPQPTTLQPIQPPETSFAEDELYVFLSFAGEDRSVAERILAFLTGAGVRVFYDRRMSSGVNWDMTIERALTECSRMVLLLSSSSMPDKPEPYREWFYFARHNKTIHALLIEDCRIHSRFEFNNYIDARADWSGALNKLLADLKRLPLSEPADPLTEYRRARIVQWSEPRYELDQRFVNLTLTLDRPDDAQQRWHPVAAPPIRDLREVLEKAKDHPALVLIGAPGSGKSTLLRRLQIDHSRDRLDDGGEEVSFFVALYEHKGELKPPEWLAKVWAERYPAMPALETLLKSGRMLLLLDALNEMKPRVGTAEEQIDDWRGFVRQAARRGNRMIFSCRSRDIGAAQLGDKELPVPLVDVQPMTEGQMREFLSAYAPEHHERIWGKLHGSRQFDLFRTPYFLKLLCEQIGPDGELPKGQAELFTGLVRNALYREKDGMLFQPGALLTRRDRQKMGGREWRNEFDLPEHGKLVGKLRDLAFEMQKRGSEVSIDYDDACRLLDDDCAEDILAAGTALSVLDVTSDTARFFHQLLQEYFAARQLAKAPNPALVHVEWQADKVAEPLTETIATLADGDPLPPLPQTGWEETTLTAAPMVTAMTKEKDSTAFVRSLIEHNLPLAARCAAAPEIKVSPELKAELRQLLIERTQDKSADLRARIAAGEALEMLGDPRFELRSGEFGDYLMPPLATIPGGKYTIGDDNGEEDEKPEGEVELPEFQIGCFPVTNAEYRLFIEAGGYEDERWWDTSEAKSWLSGETSSEGAKQSWWDTRKLLQDNWSEKSIRAQTYWTSEQKEQLIEIRGETDEMFEARIERWYPTGKLYREPEFWNDARFNNPAQPVVGVTWFEARAYCCWLTATAADGRIYRLPTEAEFEAAARGKKGRQFPYGDKFDSAKCNTFESHIRRTTPVGVFDNSTPEGAFDLSGNAYTWTLSIYDQYPYRSDDGREEVAATGVKRILRGGSWCNNPLFARAVSRLNLGPGNRNYVTGFRVVVLRPPSS